MPRNLDRRVEILFPVEKPQLQEKLHHILDSQLRDTVKASILQADGSYEKPDLRGKELFNAQLQFCHEAKATAKAEKEFGNKRVFIPEVHHEEPEPADMM